MMRDGTMHRDYSIIEEKWLNHSYQLRNQLWLELNKLFQPF